MHKDIRAVNVKIEYDLSGFELMLPDRMKEPDLIISMSKGVDDTKLVNNIEIGLNPLCMLELPMPNHGPNNLMKPLPPIKISSKSLVTLNQPNNLPRVPKRINKEKIHNRQKHLRIGFGKQTKFV
jgi:hypothetical protein